MTTLVTLLSRVFSPHQTGGVSRLGALGFFLISVAGAAITLTAPQMGRWASASLLVAIGVLALLMLIAAWPRRGKAAEEISRAASAAAASNVAWVVTSKDGAVLDCNAAYRALAGIGDGDHPASPQHAFPGRVPAAALYRLSRAANEGSEREETFDTESGQKLTATVKPLKNGEAAWWFTPRLLQGPIKPAAPERPMPSALIRFSDFFRNAPVGVAITTPTGEVVESNGAFAEFFAQAGFAPGDKFGDLVGSSERSAALKLIGRAAAGETSHEPEEVHCALNGKALDRSAQLFASPFRPSHEGMPQAILYLVDTSEQKALETQFAQSQKMQAIGQLAGGVAHDFNNLLQAIIGNCDLLLMRHPAGDPSFAEINEVRQNSVRAAGLVRQLLAFSRQQTLQPRVLALADTMTELSLLLRRLLGERITLKFEQAPELWPVRADEGQISNAIVNLVVNARDAMPVEGGTVTIRIANATLANARAVGSGLMPAGDYVLIEVADTGIGIAPEHQAKIFEPFFTTKPVGHGTGLGLSTVYGVVKQTGGFITVRSEPGKGATFEIHLPRYMPADGAAEAALEEPDRAINRDITGQDTILLVEDEDAVRSFAARALRMRGYTVLEAPGGEAALDIVRRHQGAIDLIISDVVMPNMDGPTLVRAATKLRPEMRVIFISGYAEDTFRRNEEKVEDLHFLPKPFGLKQLVAKVKEVLSGAPPRRVADALHDTGT
jgi:two-component system cell cycle sensor histidine kinase/response regulator CckA